VQATLFPRQTGGRAQRFYTPVCRRACDVDVRHEAYRAWSNGYSIVLRVDPKPPPFMVKRATPVYRMKELFHMELRQRVKPWRQGPLDKTGAVTGGFVGGTTAGLLVVGIERRGIKNP